MCSIYYIFYGSVNLKFFIFKFLLFQSFKEQFFVELIGIEPITSALQGRRSAKLSYSPKNLLGVIGLMVTLGKETHNP